MGWQEGLEAPRSVGRLGPAPRALEGIELTQVQALDGYHSRLRMPPLASGSVSGRAFTK
jgi:hypothetical protein